MATKPTAIRTRERFEQKLLIRLKDAAASIGVSEAHVRNEIRAGRLSARRAGRAVLVPVAELKRWAEDLPPAA